MRPWYSRVRNANENTSVTVTVTNGLRLYLFMLNFKIMWYPDCRIFFARSTPKRQGQRREGDRAGVFAVVVMFADA